MSEALTKRLPMVIFKPIPGQEEENTRFLKKVGAGRFARTPQELEEIVKSLIEQPGELEKMRLAATKAVLERAAQNAVEQMLDLIDEGQNLKKRPGDKVSSLFVLGLLEFVRGALVLSILPLFGQYNAGYSLEIIGIAISMHYLFDNLFRLPAGWMVDRLGGKWITVIGIAVSAVGVDLVYLHLGQTTFIIGAALFGLGVSPVWPAVIARVASEEPLHQIGEALSKVYIAWLVGAGAGPLVVNFVIGKYYPTAFYIALAALGLAFIFTAVGPRYEIAPNLPPPAVFLKEMGKEFVSLRLLYPGMFVQTMSVGILMPIISIYAREVFGLNPEQFNYLLIGGGAFTVLLLVPAGKLADRLGVKGPLIGGFLVASLCLTFFPLQRSVVPTLVIGGLLGISYSFILPAWNGLIARAVSAEKRGSMWAVFMTIEGFGTAVGAYVGGKVWESFGHQAPFFVSALVLFIMAVFYAIVNVERLIKAEAAVQ